MSDESGIWRQYAEENRQAARLLFASGLWNPCLQNCQQAVEKFLKAALVKTGHAIQKTHHIKELAAWLREKGTPPC